MPDFWRGYVSANDEVRHTYEQVFFGRQLTGNNADQMPNDAPDMGGFYGNGPGAGAPGVGAYGPEGPDNGPGVQPSTQDLYGSVYGPSGGTEATIYGPATSTAATIYDSPSAATGSNYPQLEPPTIDVTPTPQVGGPTAGNDMTPG